VSDPTTVLLRIMHTMTVTETALTFVQETRRRGELCRPLHWIPEIHHPSGRRRRHLRGPLPHRLGLDGGDGTMLRAFIEIDQTTIGLERLAAKFTAYSRLHAFAFQPVGRRQLAGLEPLREKWQRHCPLVLRVLFVLNGTDSAQIENRVHACSRNQLGTR
jgi:hypothetical protein